MMRLSSPSFASGGYIPKQHTIDGDELSPPFAWSDLPRGTKSLVLLMEDADLPAPAAPGQPFLHWLVYNLQPSSGGIALGASRTGLPPPARAGRNDRGRADYSGPAPEEVSPHRYVFRLLALGAMLQDRGADVFGRDELLVAIKGQVLDTSELTGRYERERLTPP
jgi:Raf kinase inhibitor-like YbhB/YbcL family protein